MYVIKCYLCFVQDNANPSSSVSVWMEINDYYKLRLNIDWIWLLYDERFDEICRNLPFVRKSGKPDFIIKILITRIINNNKAKDG